MSCLLDTNCLVALLSTVHEHHEVTLAELNRRQKRAEPFVLASHSLAEAYAILTRLPAPLRMAPDFAMELLEQNFAALQSISLTPAETWAALKSFPSRGISGGRTYDALIAACAKKARVDTLLTWNVAHFEPLADGFAVVAPR